MSAPTPAAQLQAKALWLKLPASHCRAWGSQGALDHPLPPALPSPSGVTLGTHVHCFSRLGVSKGRHRGGGGLGKPVEFLMGFPYNYNGGAWLRAGQGLAKPSPHPPSFLGWE